MPEAEPDRSSSIEEGKHMRYALMLLVTLLGLLTTNATRVTAQEGTPAPAASEVMQIADDTYAFVSSGYISLFIVTSEGVIATDPSSLVDPDRANRLVEAIASVTDQPVRYLIYSHSHADHATGGAVFADTATFVSHTNAVAQIAALADPNTPVPTMTFDDELSIELGGTTVELYYTGRNHSDNSIVLLHPTARVLFAVDFIPVDSLLFQSLPDAYPEEWIASLQWIEDNLDFDILVPGHPPIPGTKENVTEVRNYLQDLIAAVQSAQAQGLADNSPEMVESVRAALEPTYGEWNNFAEWLPLNIEGLLRIWSERSATPAAATPAA
jgi:glyoxylase-like metal-dependent hydrolase (beta-lactamase superfamily II)